MIRDLLFILVGIVVTHLGVLLGIHRERARKPAPSPEPTTLCTCDHYLSSHDPETHRCTEMVDVWRFVREVLQDKKFQEPCPCKQYVGPRPIDSLFLP